MLHVVIYSGGNAPLPVPNLTAEEVDSRFVQPWVRGEPVVARGWHFNAGEYRLAIHEGDEIEPSPTHAVTTVEIVSARDEVTDRLITRPFGTERQGQERVEPRASDPTSVMVVNGRDSRISGSMFTFLRAIGLHPLEWTELVSGTANGAPYIGEVLDTAFATAQAVVIVSTPDDLACLSREFVPDGDPQNELEFQGQARPNVYFEAGMALGRFAHRTILTECGTMRPASDLMGRHAVRLDDGPECRHDLASRLEHAGCRVDRSGTDWLTAGDFSPPGPPTAGPQAEPPIADPLIARIDVLVGDLGDLGHQYVPWTVAGIYNEIVEMSNVGGIPVAERQRSSIGGPGAVTNNSGMRASSMRTHLNQLKAQLT